MPQPKTSFTYELDAEQQEKLLAMLALGNYRPRQVPYSMAAVEGDGFNCALYQKEKHGRRKLCIQGSKAQDFVEFFLEPNVLGVALWLVRSWLGARGWTGTWANVTQLGTLVALGGVVYFGVHFIFARHTFAARLRSLRRRR